MRRTLALLIALTVLGTASCARLPAGAGYNRDAATFGSVIPQEAKALEPGAATYAEVVDLLGPPSVITALPEGFAFLYEGGSLDNQSVEVTVYSVRGGYSWSKAGFSAAVFVFDAGGQLRGKAIEERNDGTGRGMAVGTHRSNAADQAIYLVPAQQTFWGRQMLRRIPRTLNDASNLDSGQAGLERRGTTSKVGQRTLESGYLTALGLLELLKQQTGN
ncbi:hypothetical protein KHP62_04960 [Rhodobacteraceae bacterium NNCM2]|nr:hypothetical protein [Coraliihabitans acroporae]